MTPPLTFRPISPTKLLARSRFVYLGHWNIMYVNHTNTNITARPSHYRNRLCVFLGFTS